jgi:hypothetical protein
MFVGEGVVGGGEGAHALCSGGLGAEWRSGVRSGGWSGENVHSAWKAQLLLSREEREPSAGCCRRGYGLRAATDSSLEKSNSPDPNPAAEHPGLVAHPADVSEVTGGLPVDSSMSPTTRVEGRIEQPRERPRRPARLSQAPGPIDQLRERCEICVLS